MAGIYLDHQASTPMHGIVLEAMLGAGYGNASSIEHSFGWEAAAKIERARQQVAGMIGSDTDEIFFTSGATEANNLAILGMRKERERGKDRVLRSSIEHKSVLAACEALTEYGFSVDEISVDREGKVSPDTIAAMVTAQTALISIALVNNEIGIIQDIVSIASSRRNVFLHCDAAQAPYATDLSGIATKCDMLSLSAHKMGGPMGVGALYISRELQPLITPILFGGGQQRGIRPGTLPLSLCVGMGAACEIVASSGMEERAKVAEIRDRFLVHLRQGGLDFELNGTKDHKLRHPGNANINIKGMDAEQLLMMLQPEVAASTGSACTSGSLEPSHVLTAIGLSIEEAASSIRFSVGRTTTESDILNAAKAIVSAAARLA